MKTIILLIFFFLLTLTIMGQKVGLGINSGRDEPFTNYYLLVEGNNFYFEVGSNFNFHKSTILPTNFRTIYTAMGYYIPLNNTIGILPFFGLISITDLGHVKNHYSGNLFDLGGKIQLNLNKISINMGFSLKQYVSIGLSYNFFN